MTESYPISSTVEVVGTVGSPGSLILSNGINSIEIKAPASLSETFTIALPSTAGVINQFLQKTGPTSIGWATFNNPNVESTLPMTISFSDPNGNPHKTSSTTFFALTDILYRGTSVDNTIDKIYAIVSTKGNNSSGQVQVFDYTNGNIIATSAIFGPQSGGLSKTIIDLGTISNLPLGSAILEVQLRRVNTNAGGNAKMHSVQFLG